MFLDLDELILTLISLVEHAQLVAALLSVVHFTPLESVLIRGIPMFIDRNILSL